MMHQGTGRPVARARHAALVAGVLTLAACSAGPPSAPETRTVTVTPTYERSTAPAPELPERPEPVLDTGAVNAGHPAATAAGIEVLAEGGNAVDAAIAAAFAVTVAEPFGSGLGGGGSAILVAPGEDPVNVDYRDVVPASGVPADFTGVPGLVAGLWHLHSERGTMPWARLVQPAIDLARDGVPVSQMLHDQMRMRYGSGAVQGLEHFAPGGRPLAKGDLLVQEELARSLTIVAEDGVDGFYRGRLAAQLAKAHKSLDAASLGAYEVQVSPPPRGQFGEYTVLGASPALPGPGFIQLLQLVEALDVASTTPGSAEYVNVVATALRRALRTMKNEIGDPAFVDVDSDTLTDREANARLARGLGLAGPDPQPDPTSDPSPDPTPKKPRPTKKPKPDPKPDPTPTRTTEPEPEPDQEPEPEDTETPPEGPDDVEPPPGDAGGAWEPVPWDEEQTSPGETTHLTVVDSSGLMVTMTNTLTSLWGSRQYVGGFFLNDQLNRFAKIAGPKNTPSPGRRTVSWSLPAILVDAEGRPVLGIGSPAGERIPAILTNVLVRWGLFGQDLQTAVSAPRFHAAGRALDMEWSPGRGDREKLEKMGYQITAPIPQNLYFYGSVQAIEVDWATGTVSGAEDTRREASFALAPTPTD